MEGKISDISFDDYGEGEERDDMED